jgi:hypothetical protein
MTGTGMSGRYTWAAPVESKNRARRVRTNTETRTAWLRKHRGSHAGRVHPITAAIAPGRRWRPWAQKRAGNRGTIEEKQRTTKGRIETLPRSPRHGGANLPPCPCQTLTSRWAGVIGARTAAELAQTQSGLAAQWQAAATPPLAGLGLEVLSLSARDVAIADKARV